jgi:hypothetical protein
MADANDQNVSIFRQSAMSRIASADDLDKYIRIANPSTWIMLLAAASLLVGLVIWSMTAVIPSTKSYVGILTSDGAMCWVDADVAEKVRRGGAKATIMDRPVVGEIRVDEFPLSAGEAKQVVSSEYVADSIALTDWNYTLHLPVPDGVPVSENLRLVPISITVSEDRPVDLVLGKQ